MELHNDQLLLSSRHSDPLLDCAGDPVRPPSAASSAARARQASGMAECRRGACLTDAAVVDHHRHVARRSAVTIGVIVGVANMAGRLVNTVAPPKRRARDQQEAHVDSWKNAWEAGAQAVWTAGPSALSPDTRDDAVRADAWEAGAQWARSHPDRREPSRVRLAHPLRRRSDTKSRLRRVAKAGGVGLSVLAFVGWRLRKVRSRESKSDR